MYHYLMLYYLPWDYFNVVLFPISLLKFYSFDAPLFDVILFEFAVFIAAVVNATLFHVPLW